MVINVVIGFFVAMSSGCAVVIAQIYGAKNHEKLSRATGTAVAMCLLIGAVLSAVGYFLTPAMLRLLKTPEDTLAGSICYLQIIFLGTIPNLLYNIESGILRAVGDSRSPFLYLCICCAVNIILDLTFVIYFDMGVSGVAIATVLSQVISAVLATVKLMRTKESHRLMLSRIRLDKVLLRHMMELGIPSGLQSVMYTFSSMIIQVAINTLGTVVVAGWTLAGKVDGFYWACSGAAGVAVMNFTAQNYGAGKEDRIRECRRKAMLLFTAFTVFSSLLILSLSKTVLPLFTDDQAVIDQTFQIMMYFVPVYFTWTYVEIISGALRGVGDAVKPTIICGLGICLFRLLWTIVVFPLIPNIFIVSVCYPISWVITDIAFFCYCRKSKWKSMMA